MGLRESIVTYRKLAVQAFGFLPEFVSKLSLYFTNSGARSERINAIRQALKIAVDCV